MDGAAPPVAIDSTPTSDVFGRREDNSTKKNGVDAGVQVNLIGQDLSALMAAKE